MPWFKVDDTLTFHAKVVAAGNPAMGLWVRAGAWSSQHLTEGFIPTHIAATIGTRGEAKRLVEVGLWLAESDGYRFWQWDKDGRQPSKAKVEADRAAARERQRKARERSKESRRDNDVTDGVTSGVVTVPPTRPDPTRPLVVVSESGERPETLRAVDGTTPPTQTRCTRHPNGNPDDEPCGGCRRDREHDDKADKRAEQDRRASAAAVLAACGYCDPDGWLLADDGSPTARKCNRHRRTA